MSVCLCMVRCEVKWRFRIPFAFRVGNPAKKEFSSSNEMNPHQFKINCIDNNDEFSKFCCVLDFCLSDLCLPDFPLYIACCPSGMSPFPKL